MTLEEIIEEYGDIILGAIIVGMVFGIIAAGFKDDGMVSQFLSGVLDACAGW